MPLCPLPQLQAPASVLGTQKEPLRKLLGILTHPLAPTEQDTQSLCKQNCTQPWNAYPHPSGPFCLEGA